MEEKIACGIRGDNAVVAVGVVFQQSVVRFRTVDIVRFQECPPQASSRWDTHVDFSVAHLMTNLMAYGGSAFRHLDAQSRWRRTDPSPLVEGMSARKAESKKDK